ncbi:MAG: uroporphyrinogen decarboxylase [Armatimonadetes bacterium]|nr:uroporphyrinogen decarboxylase [Armatimonadota bacterium]
MATPIATKTGFNGALVVAFESRHAREMASLIESYGGRALVAPSMREVPLSENAPAFAFAERLLAGEVDIILCTTGVGTRTLFEVLETRTPRERLVQAFSATQVVARGPKPVKALRELGIPIALTVPEPNTWREVLAALDAHAGEMPLAGRRIAVQEYGISNEELLKGLATRGAEVIPVPVYRWALPEDQEPLQRALDALVAGQVQVVLFTSATQVEHVLAWAEQEGRGREVREALGRTAICSIGPVCTEALQSRGLPVDLEPEHPRMGHLVKEASERIPVLFRNLAAGRGGRAALCSAGLQPALECGGGVPSGPPLPGRQDACATARPPWWDSPFMKACRREPAEVTPIWLMRQAGRYMKEYRAVRARVPFLELCRTPHLVAEVTVTAAQRLGVDAAILFADILLVAEPMGLTLTFGPGEGPVIRPPVRTAAEVDRLREVDPQALTYVYEAVRLTRAALNPRTPLLGFSGAPFTIASYLVEGGASRHFEHSKTLMYSDPGAWHALMEKITRALAGTLNGQIAAGAQAVQLFDSWVGCLSPRDYRDYVLPHTRAVIQALPPGVPVIHFGTGTAALLEGMRAAGGDVIGLDWRVELDEAWSRLGSDVGVMGNLDSVVLLAPKEVIYARAQRILDQAAGRPGHIFNLGHGILPQTPVEHAIALVDYVHEHSAR